MTTIVRPSSNFRGIFSIRLIVTQSRKELAIRAARILAGKINASREPHIGFATGSTPVETYKSLASLYQLGELSQKNVSRLTAWSLDEYVLDPKVAAKHAEFQAQTYARYMDEYLYNPLGIPHNRQNILSWKTESPTSECDRYEANIRARDKKTAVQLLGIGPTEEIEGKHVGGHIGFNESGTPFSSTTHVIELSPRTRVANSRLFMTAEERIFLGLEKDEDPYDKLIGNRFSERQKELFFSVILSRVPRFAMTMGIATILDTSDSLLLLALGEGKAHAIFNALFRPNEETPASAIWHHPETTVIVDQKAASLLRFTEPGEYEIEPKPYRI